MTPREVSLLKSVLSSATDYVEFGCGGSTYVASERVGKTITCVDSSTEWLETVSAACRGIKPQAIHVDIGPLKEWGWPADDSMRHNWPRYYESLWTKFPATTQADTFLVDGRFRVACFCTVLLTAKNNPLILIHDFQRPFYSAILDFAEEIVGVQKLSLFRKKAVVDRNRLVECLQSHAYDAR